MQPLMKRQLRGKYLRRENGSWNEGLLNAPLSTLARRQCGQCPSLTRNSSYGWMGLLGAGRQSCI